MTKETRVDRRSVIGGLAAVAAAPRAAFSQPAPESGRRWSPAATLPPPKGDYVSPDGLVRIRGTDIMRTLIEGLNRRFSAAHPAFRFQTDLRPGLMAIGPAAYGTTPFAPMPRLLTRVEMDAFRSIAGREPFVVPVAHGSTVARDRTAVLAIYVHRDNPIQGLTMDQLAGLFGTGRPAGDITTWGQLGLGGEWANRRIHPVGTPLDAGFGSYISNRIGLPLTPRITMRPISTDVMKLVGTDLGAIAYAAINFGTPLARQVGIRPADEGPWMTGSDDDVVAGRYPLDRFVYLYALPRPDGGIEPWIADYMRLALSADGQAVVAADTGSFLPLDAHTAGTELSRLPSAGGRRS